MAKITPFKAIRPVRDKVHLVATRPYYSYKKNVLKAKLEDNPFTFLHIINPEFGGERKTQPNTPDRFALVSEQYEAFLNNGILIQDQEEHIYVYRQTKEEHEFTGIVCGADVQEYFEDKIKKHEATLTSREQMFTDYLDIVGYNAEPVLLSHPQNEEVDLFLNRVTLVRPEYEFTTTDRIKHELWILSKEDSKIIASIFDKMDALYIADGHHRSASSAGLYNKRKNKEHHFPNENAFLSFIIDDSKLKILEFNRLVKHLKGITKTEFIKKIEDSFFIEKATPNTLPCKEHEITLAFSDDWYKLTCKPDIIDHGHPVKCLDAEILTQYILDPILNIKDLKTDDNIEFVSGAVPLKKVTKLLEKGTYELALFLFPISMEQVKRVADNQMIMPPKSTWVEPKLRSGLTIYNINE